MATSETITYEFYANVRKVVTRTPTGTRDRYAEPEPTTTDKTEIVEVTLRGGPELAENLSAIIRTRMEQDTNDS